MIARFGCGQRLSAFVHWPTLPLWHRVATLDERSAAMSLMFFLAALFAIGTGDQPLEDLATRNLQVYAWYCDGTGCADTPRRFAGTVEFDTVRSSLPADIKAFGQESWTAVLTCNATRGRLAACRVEPDSTATGEAADHALALTRRLHLRSTSAVRNKRAAILLSITYSAGECGWQCVPTPAPPRLPG